MDDPVLWCFSNIYYIHCQLELRELVGPVVGSRGGGLGGIFSSPSCVNYYLLLLSACCESHLGNHYRNDLLYTEYVGKGLGAAKLSMLAAFGQHCLKYLGSNLLRSCYEVTPQTLCI